MTVRTANTFGGSGVDDGGFGRWAASTRAREWRSEPPPAAVTAFHRTMPGYAVTRLVEVPTLAAELGVGRVLVKEESARFGLPAFKVLGVSWAVARVVLAAAPDGAALQGAPVDVTWDRVVAAARRVDLTLVTATDGNHGRALAAVAARLGLRCRVLVPAVMTADAAGAIAAEGADVVRHAGTYDETVAAAADHAADDPRAALVQDTAWDGYEQVPGWIVEGYSTLLAEIDDVVAVRDDDDPADGLRIDLTVVPTGVGSLAQAVVAWNRSRLGGPAAAAADGAGTDGAGADAVGNPDRHRRAVLAAEPDTAACVTASLRADERRSVATAATVMAGLNCGTPSSLAWPVLARGLDAAVAVRDEEAIAAVADLAQVGIDAGPSGAAALAAARAALRGPDSPQRRAHLGIGPDATVVLLSTEGRGREDA